MSVDFVIGSLPESLTQGLLIGKLLIGGLGVNGVGRMDFPPAAPQERQMNRRDTMNNNEYIINNGLTNCNIKDYKKRRR